MFYMAKVAKIRGKKVRDEFPTEYNNLIGLLIINTLTYAGYTVTSVFFFNRKQDFINSPAWIFEATALLDFISIGFTLLLHIKSFGG